MKSVSMSGSLRENVGKKDAKQQRASGMIPCVMYGQGTQKHILIHENDFKNLIYTSEVRYAEITIDGQLHKAILQETQFHPVTEKLLHVDFLEVVDDKPITIAIPMHTKGNSPGVMRGGRLIKRVRKVKVHGLLANIPEDIQIDISKMDILDNVKVSDLNIDQLTIVEQPSKVLVSVMPTRNVEDNPQATEEAAAE